MKRSKSVTLALMGTAALALTGCDDTPPQPQAAAYSGIQQCIESGNAVDLCAAEYKKALEAHAAQAPRFANQQECETGADSQCQSTRVQNSDGSFSDVFVPLMAGYMISQAIDDIGDARERRRNYGYVSTPIYNSRTYAGSQRDLGNVRSLQTSTALSTAPRGSSVAPSAPRGSSTSLSTRPAPAVKVAPPPNVKTTTVARGGFGSGKSFARGLSGGS